MSAAVASVVAMEATIITKFGTSDSLLSAIVCMELSPLALLSTRVVVAFFPPDPDAVCVTVMFCDVAAVLPSASVTVSVTVCVPGPNVYENEDAVDTSVPAIVHERSEMALLPALVSVNVATNGADPLVALAENETVRSTNS